MKSVLIYSTPTCPYCVRVKQFLKSKGVEYTDYDVAGDEEKAQEMINKSKQMGVPVLDIDGEIVIGFDKDKISELLGIEG